MTDHDALADLDRRPLTDDRDLERYLTALMRKGSVWRTWVMLLDDQWRSTKVIIPIDGLPKDPQEPAAMPSGGPVSAARVLGVRIAEIVEQTPAAAAVVIWERPGGVGADPKLDRWVSGMREAFAAGPEALRAQVLLGDEGAKVLGDAVLRRAA